jgi:predicted Zn-dependent protease
MIFQWSRESESWELFADSGELLGQAKETPGNLARATMTKLGGGRSAWATDLQTIREWMMTEARTPRHDVS